jgi:hypothetical protein
MGHLGLSCGRLAPSCGKFRIVLYAAKKGLDLEVTPRLHV